MRAISSSRLSTRTRWLDRDEPHLVARFAREQHLVARLDRADVGPDRGHDPGHALRRLVDRDDQPAGGLGLVERLDRRDSRRAARASRRRGSADDHVQATRAAQRSAQRLGGQSRPAAMIRCRNCCVRGSRGAGEDLLGRALLEDDAAVEEADAVGDVAREAPSRAWRSASSSRRRRARGSPRAPRRRARDRARSSPRRAASARAPSRARARSRRAAAGRPRAGPGTRRACRRARSGRADRARAASASARERPSTVRGASVTLRSTRHVRKEVERLEDDPDPAPDAVRVDARRGDLRRRRATIRPRVDRLDQVHAAEERRLARAGRADQADDLVLGDGEVDAAQHRRLPNDLRTPSRTSGRSLTAPPPPGGAAGRAGSASR